MASKEEKTYHEKSMSFARQNAAKKFEPIDVSEFPEVLRPAVGELDLDGDGKIQPSEILQALVLREDVIAKGEKKNQSLKLAVIALSIALLIMLAGNFGLTAAVVYMTKDTEVNANVLTDIHGTPLATASTDMTIASDKMTGATALVSKATNEAVSVHAIDEETSAQVSYDMPLGELQEMRHLGYASGVNDFQVAVNGFARNKTVLQLFTVEGDLLLCVSTPSLTTPLPARWTFSRLAPLWMLCIKPQARQDLTMSFCVHPPRHRSGSQTPQRTTRAANSPV